MAVGMVVALECVYVHVGVVVGLECVRVHVCRCVAVHAAPTDPSIHPPPVPGLCFHSCVHRLTDCLTA